MPRHALDEMDLQGGNASASVAGVSGMNGTDDDWDEDEEEEWLEFPNGTRVQRFKSLPNETFNAS